MSNGRRLRKSTADKAALPRCGSCGARVGALAARVVLADGRLVCARCRDAGVLSQRLPCGHLGIPGMLIIADSADRSNFQCARCSPHANLPPGYPGGNEAHARGPDRSRVPMIRSPDG